MEECVLQRVISICRQKSVSESQFAKMIGSNQKTINQQFRGERSISLDTISKILSSFEDVSAEWLLRGEGDMYRTSNMDYEKSESYNEELLKNFVDQTDILLSNRDERIRELEMENAALKSGISIKNVG